MALYHKDKIEKFDNEARNDCIEIFRLNMERDDRQALFMNNMLRMAFTDICTSNFSGKYFAAEFRQ